MHAFNDCTARTSYLLERGRPVSHVLWSLGDEVDHKPDQYAPFPEGFKYDYCNPDILLHRLSVQDGRLVTPEGLSYGLLWLPRAGRLMPETLERLVQLVSEGAVLVGDRPRCPATLADPEATQQRFDQAVSTLWGNDTSVCRAVGRGRVLSGISIDEALATLDLHPDVVAHDVQWLHRTTQGADWYFVCPPRGKTFQGTLRFHARGDVSLWDPVTGRVQHVTGTTASEEYTDVELSLAQAETRFVVFTHTSEVNERNSERHKTCLDGRVVKLEDEVNGTSFPWHRCVEGQGGGVLPPTTADAPHAVLITLHEPTVVRTLVLSSVQSWNHPWCYAPGVHIKVEAVADGPLTEEAFGGSSSLTVFDDDMPQSCWQDEMNLSLALDEAPATTCWRVSITNSHDMALSALRLLSAARKNNWESECGRTLRALMPNSQPSQSNEAYIDKDKILDLTAALSSDGRLHTSLPEGAWTVLRLGHVNTGKKNAPAPPEATGFECNKYAVEGAQKHFAGYIGKLMDGPLAGARLDGMLLDSWECEYQTWTKEMESEFRALHGYDLQSYLPALFGWVVDSDETTTRFLRDWRALINRLSVDRFYGEMARLGHVRGLTVTYETAAGDVFPADIMEYFKHADLPMCEFWSHPTDEFIGSLNFKPIKPTVSASRLYGKPRVAAEAFTAWTTTWDENLSALRDVANHNLIEGVVKIVTCFDVPERPFPTAGHPWSTEKSHQDVADRLLLNRHVRYYGDEVANVKMEMLEECSIMEFVHFDEADAIVHAV